MSAPPETDSRLTEARQCMRKRQYRDAIAKFEEVLADDSRDAAAHEGLATAAFMLKEYDVAIEHFKRVTMVDPRRAQPLINLGAVYNRMGDHNTAVQSLRKALGKDSKSAEAYYNLGIAHRGLNQLSMAVSAYKEAIRLAPEMAEAYQNLANVFVDMGNSQQAVSHYERALQIRPDFERARRGLARAKEAQQQAKETASPFGRLVDETQAKRTENEAVSRRVMTEQERYDDRQAVHGHAKESERAAAALLHQMQSELEARLHAFTRVFTQSSDARAYWGEYSALCEAATSYEKFLDLLQRRVDDLRSHEAFVQESVTKDGP